MIHFRTLTARPMPVLRNAPSYATRFDQHDEAALVALMTRKPAPKPRPSATRNFNASQLVGALYCRRRKAFIECTMGDFTRILGVKPTSMSPAVNHGFIAWQDMGGEKVYRLTEKGRDLARKMGAMA